MKDKEIKEVVDLEGNLIYIVKGKKIIGVRDFEGNIYNGDGKKIGHIDC